MNNSIFIISFFRGRTNHYLAKLVEQLEIFNIPIAVIVNDPSAQNLELTNHNNHYFLRRPNTGMNIGAWDEGWRYFYGYENYFFFQDECFIKKNDFLERYIEFLSIRDLGMVGENINPKWDMDWNELLKIKIFNKKIIVNDNEENQVEYYLKKINEWGINAGKSARHLRSLNWALNFKTLELINGFPIGLNKYECIASEISVSKKVEEKKLNIIQSSKDHFSYIGHKEWPSNGISKYKKIHSKK